MELDAATVVAIFGGFTSLVTAVGAVVIAFRQGSQTEKIDKIDSQAKVIHTAVNSERDKLNLKLAKVEDTLEKMHGIVLRLTADNTQLKEQRQAEAVAAARAMAPLAAAEPIPVVVIPADPIPVVVRKN